MSCSFRENTEPESRHVRADPCSPGAGAVLAVIVLYKRPFKEVPCFARVMRWLSASIADPERLRLAHCVVYDNSPEAQPLDVDTSSGRIQAFHDASNGGTRAAYLYALSIARAHGYPWILFLDHDTDLPEDYLEAAECELSSARADARICAVVPRVHDGGTLISPSCITTYGRVYAQTQRNGTTAGNGSDELTAIASASLVRTESLAALLPIPETFSLDYLDHWLFRELQRQGGRIAVSSAEVAHSLSVQSRESIGTDRYGAILAAEIAFLRSGERYSMLRHLVWHFGRTIKLAISTRRPALVGVCIRAAVNILRK